MPTEFTLAHLSDVHLGPIAGLRPRLIDAKRLTGLANWHWTRRRLHRMDVLARIVADLLARRPDHIAVTGDLANLGLPGELEAGRRWLERLGPPGLVTVIPGNHDLYTDLRGDRGVARWAPYMQANSPPPCGTEVRFPFVRLCGEVVLIALNSAHPTPPFIASGRLGREQLETAEQLLRDNGRLGLARVVLVHHPPLPGQAAPRKALADGAEMAAMLSRAGAELVLHGHNHRRMLAWTPGPQGLQVPVVGVPSASQVHARADETAGYHLFHIRGRPGDWRIEWQARGMLPDGTIGTAMQRQPLVSPHRPVS